MFVLAYAKKCLCHEVAEWKGGGQPVAVTAKVLLYLIH